MQPIDILVLIRRKLIINWCGSNNQVWGKENLIAGGKDSQLPPISSHLLQYNTIAFTVSTTPSNRSIYIFLFTLADPLVISFTDSVLSGPGCHPSSQSRQCPWLLSKPICCLIWMWYFHSFFFHFFFFFYLESLESEFGHWHNTLGLMLCPRVKEQSNISKNLWK